MNVKHLIFDLDDTLYSGTSDLSEEISRLMTGCVADFFGVDFAKAKEMRAENLPKHSSTLAWLMSCGFNKVEEFFATVHPEDETKHLYPDPKIRGLLESFNLPMSVLTNAPKEHAERVLDFYGIRDLFSSITDIRDGELKGKPFSLSYEIALKKAGGTFQDSIFIDDQMKYVLGYKILGGTAVHIGAELPMEKMKNYPSFLLENMDKGGKVFHIPSIYQLPEVLQQLKEMQ